MNFIINISVCFILSFLIGLERQWQRRITGLRTNVLVSIGACLFTIINVKIGTSSDMTRVAAQVVSGIGFLGAGVILKDGTHIKGLNTAATLWCTAAIGVLCAYGYLEEAIIGTIFVLLSNILLRALGFKMLDKNINNDSNYVINLVCKEKYAKEYRNNMIEWLSKTTMTEAGLDQIEVGTDKIKIVLFVNSRNSILVEEKVSEFSKDENVLSISWKAVDEEYKKAMETDDI